LRHTHASSLIAAGIDILTISRRLGHANPKITLSVYGHLYGNTDGKAAQAVEAMFRADRRNEVRTNTRCCGGNPVAISTLRLSPQMLTR